jgi:hypothetical protein
MLQRTRWAVRVLVRTCLICVAWRALWNRYKYYPTSPDIPSPLWEFGYGQTYLLRRILVHKPKDLHRDWSPRFSTLRDKDGWIRAKTA